jgi:quinoprotein glucose dehydrogenase
VVDLTQGIGPFTAGGYYSTSPAAITRDLVIMGGHVTDNESTNEPSGVIRAFDVRDGHLVWNWDSNNPDATEPLAPGETYSRNSANMWSLASVDEKLGMVYLPLGNQTPDQWGADRTPAPRNSAPASSPWTWPPAKCAGTTSSPTTTCGTWTLAASQPCST